MGTNEISADELVARLTKIYGAAFDAVARDYTLDSPRKAGIVAVLEFLTATSRLVSADDIRLTTVRRADVITVANAALQYGDSTLGEAAHRILSQFPITGTVNPTTEPDDTDTEQRTESESFSFLNELAGAFRHGEANPRPSHFPVLEGIRAVLAHLHSAGRLLSADEQRPTAEQVENVRTARKTLRGYRNYERHHVNQLIAAVDALFPATEPAEAKGGTIISGLIDCHASYTLTAEEYADFLNVIWEGRGDYSSRDRLREKFPTSEHDEARLQRKSALASSDGDCFDVCEGHPAGMTMAHIHHHEAEPPAPAEPAEEETKAGPWTVQLPEGMTLEQWIESLPDEAPGLLAAVREVRERLGISSPVVPAPTETGPWQRIEDVPEGVFVVASGAVYVGGPVWRTSGLRDGVNRSAPFFESVEEQP